MAADEREQKQRHKTEADSTDIDEARLAEKRKKESRNREMRSWIISITAAVAVALILRFFVFEFVRVEGESMLPALQDEEYVFMEKATYWFSTPQRGDIVICHFPNSTDTFVKRVIGIGGDTLRITDGVLYINGEANSDYFSGSIKSEMAQITVPDDSLFVMGDNRNDSTDSRVVGALKRDMVLGKAVWIIWPPGDMGGI